MTAQPAEPSGHQPQQQLLERSRIAITEMPDGSWVIRRAGPICQTCQDCGCGDQADPLVIPAMAISAWKAMQAGNRKGAIATAKALMSRG